MTPFLRSRRDAGTSKVRHRYVHNDSYGLNRSVEEFNRHDGPARIFYNRNSRTFYTSCYEEGYQDYFGELLDSFDVIELYRKTDGKVKVTREELLYLENNVGPYKQW